MKLLHAELITQYKVLSNQSDGCAVSGQSNSTDLCFVLQLPIE